jgi:EAL domain-containing protein (putative c-di-GMP-specific phosphodiesterase class I)
MASRAPAREPAPNRVVLVAEDYQFLDTFYGAGPAIVHEWQVASSLQELQELAHPQPLAIVIDLETPGIEAAQFLGLIGSLHLQSRIVLLKGGDLRKLSNAMRAATALGLDVVGTLDRPLQMHALSKLLARHAATSAPVTAEEIHRALEQYEFVLHYQPVLARQRQHWKVCGVEALVRWQHPERGLLYPGQFLKAAEATGQLHGLTDFVFDAAVRQAGLWHARALDLTMAINLAPRLVRDGGFLDRFMGVLHEHGLPPELVTLEVIEAASLQDRELVRDVFGRLRLHGVALSLDDFGTGYSSLTELCSLPFNEIKIDRALIHDVPGVPAASTIVSAIVELAHRLSMRVCAEGVETQAAFDFLAAAGCDSMQGVLFAKPMPALEVEEFVARHDWPTSAATA